MREREERVRFVAHSDESSSDPSSNFSVFTFDNASRVMRSFCFRAFRVDSRRGVLSTHNSALFIGGFKSTVEFHYTGLFFTLQFGIGPV